MVCLFFLAGGALGESNVEPNQAFSWAPNAGWLNWHANSANGAEIGEFVCSGFLYSPNLGWINLGGGSPADGIYYRNDSASDFGVNLTPAGQLRGFAYGANIGWIAFEDQGAPEVDLRTGRLTGHAYSANLGWISLSSASFTVQVGSIKPGRDSDGDWIPDAWEIQHASDLSKLGQNDDRDQDGHSDYEEYLADTNPLDAQDQFRILALSLEPGGTHATVSWTARPTRSYSIWVRSQLEGETPWDTRGTGLIMSESPVLTKRVLLHLEDPAAYFRIRAQRPLE